MPKMYDQNIRKSSQWKIQNTLKLSTGYNVLLSREEQKHGVEQQDFATANAAPNGGLALHDRNIYDEFK